MQLYAALSCVPRILRELEDLSGSTTKKGTPPRQDFFIPLITSLSKVNTIFLRKYLTRNVIRLT
jgi:hypothetical protein